MKTGLLLKSEPLKHGAIPLDDYVVEGAPGVPAELHCPHAASYPWGLLGNDDWGDCVWAALLHGDETLYLKRNLTPHPYQTPQALALYATTGFDPTKGGPGQNPTDQGTDPAQAMAYWRDQGFPGHQIAGFGSLPGSSPNLRRAIWEFGAVILALGLPADWQTGVSPSGAVRWTGSNHGPQADGHGVVATGFTPDGIEIVTWGNGESFLDNAYAGAYLEQAFVPLSHDAINRRGVGPAGFNFARMAADLPR